MKEILQKILFTKGLIGGTVWSTFGLFSNSVFYFLYLSFVGKIVSAEGVGVLGIFYSFYTFSSFFLGSGFRDYLTRKITELKAKNEYKKLSDLLDETFTYVFLTFIFSFIFFFVFKDLLLKKLFNNSFFLFLCAFLAHFFSTISLIGRGILLGKKLFYLFSLLTFIRGLIFLIFGFLFFLKGIDKIPIFIIPYIISEFSNFIFFVLYFIYLKKGFRFKANFNFLKEGIFSMSFSNTVFQGFYNYPIILMKIKNISDTLIGNLTAEISIFQSVRLFFNSYFVPVYPHVASSYYEGKRKKFFKTIFYSLILIFTSVLAFTILVIFGGKTFLYLFFPKNKFTFYTSEFLLLSLSLLLHLLTRFFSRIFFAIQRENFVFNILLMWLLILTIPYVIIKSNNEIIFLLFLINILSFISALIFIYFSIKIFTKKGSNPFKEGEIRNENFS
ncbi:MAG: hypothetical protein ABIN15_00380 [candidate division WOR-3 bacterium]